MLHRCLSLPLYQSELVSLFGEPHRVLTEFYGDVSVIFISEMPK